MARAGSRAKSKLVSVTATIAIPPVLLVAAGWWIVARYDDGASAGPLAVIGAGVALRAL